MIDCGNRCSLGAGDLAVTSEADDTDEELDLRLGSAPFSVTESSPITVMFVVIVLLIVLLK